MYKARITLFAGHYGSGKTNLAVNYALALAGEGQRVTVCDLDIVNPYFRTADARRVLGEAGVELIASRHANSNVDAPALPPEAGAVFEDEGRTGVIDVGGDDAGALALGRYAGALRQQGSYEMLLVLNCYRPMTRTVRGLALVRGEIEAAAQLPFTGLINNSNLGKATTADDVAQTLGFAREAAKALALPLRFTAVRRDLAARLALGNDDGALWPIDIYGKENWQI